MPLQTPNWDLDQPEIQAALVNFVSRNDPRAQVLLTAAAGNRFKLQVYALGLSDVVGTNGLKAASPVAWRYLAEANGLAVAVETTRASGRFTSIRDGQPAEQAIKVLIALQQNEQLQAGNRGVVHLRIGGVRVESYWLRPSGNGGDAGIADLIVPFSTLNKDVKSPDVSPFLQIDPFLKAIQPAAQRDLTFYGSDLSSEPHTKRGARAESRRKKR
jgi:hypothetical protein